MMQTLNIVQQHYLETNLVWVLYQFVFKSIRYMRHHAISVEEMAKCREIERLHFDTLVQTHPELAFMTSGCAGRIKYQIIPSVNEEHSHIQFNELERAPILDLNQRRFRQSFPLSADYQLQERTKLLPLTSMNRSHTIDADDGYGPTSKSLQ